VINKERMKLYHLLWCLSVMVLACVGHMAAMEEAGRFCDEESKRVISLPNLRVVYSSVYAPSLERLKSLPQLQELQNGDVIWRRRAASDSSSGVSHPATAQPSEGKGCCRRLSAWWYQEKGAQKKKSLGEKLNDLWG
jgi:hypothetical protein